LLSLAPQLEAFAIHEHDEQVVANRLSADDWKRFAQLQHLMIGKGSTCLTTWHNNSDSIPPQLESLTILDLGDHGKAELYEELQGVIAGWKGRVKRSLSIKVKQAVEDDDAGVTAGARESLLRSAEESGVVLTEVPANGSFKDWETFFDVW